MSKITPSVGIVAISDDKVLLVRHEEAAGHVTGTYGLPGGRVNNDESEQEAAAREFTEETGLLAKVVDFKEFPNNYYKAKIPRSDGSVINFGWRVFKVVNFMGELRGDHETTPEWVKIEDLKEFKRKNSLLVNTIDVINAALE